MGMQDLFSLTYVFLLESHTHPGSMALGRWGLRPLPTAEPREAPPQLQLPQPASTNSGLEVPWGPCW